MGPSSRPVLLPPQLFRAAVPKSDAEWRTAGQEAATLLSQYIAINTTNPPGNEIKAAEWLRAVLGREGGGGQSFPPGPGQGNPVGRGGGGGAAGPLVVLS